MARARSGLQVLATGLWPDVDWIGRPLDEGRRQKAGSQLAGGWRGTYVLARGDWKFHKEAFCLRAYDTTLMCHKCFATKDDGPLNYAQFGAGAGWRDHPCTHAAYMASMSTSERLNPLCSLPGWHHSSIKMCTMHCLNLGVGMHVNGSALWELLRDNRLCGHARLGVLLRRAWIRPWSLHAR